MAGGTNAVNGSQACSLEVILPVSLKPKLLEKGWYVTKDNYLHDPLTQTGIDLRGDSNPNRKVIFFDGPDNDLVYIETDECDGGVHYYLINLRTGNFDEISRQQMQLGAQAVYIPGTSEVYSPDEIGRILDQRSEVNPVYSLFSIRSAFRLLAMGLQDDNYRSLATQIGLDSSKEKEASDAKSVNKSLTGQSDVTVRVSNWAYDKAPEQFTTFYKNALKGLAQITSLDFANNPTGAMQAINSQVSRDTGGLISELVDGNLVNSNTSFVLTSALYFKGEWKSRFEKNNTTNNFFYKENGSTVTAPMMHQKNEFLYTEKQGYQAISLPYQGERFSMVVVLPGEGSRLAMSESTYLDLIGGMSVRKVDVSLPRFSVESTIPLSDFADSLGLYSIDYSGMTSALVSEIDAVSKVVFKVDEDGSEGAAATAVVATKGLAVSRDPVFKADHPFYYAVVDKDTGTVLFQGRMDDPTQK